MLVGEEMCYVSCGQDVTASKVPLDWNSIQKMIPFPWYFMREVRLKYVPGNSQHLHMYLLEEWSN